METLPLKNQPAITPTPITPQNFQAQEPLNNYASMDRRFVASFIDGIIVIAINSLVTGFFGLVTGQLFGYGNISVGKADAPTLGSSLVTMLGSVVNLVLTFGYFVYFIGKSGQTLGKKILHIRVVTDVSGLAPGYFSAFLREVIGKLISSIFLLGYIWAFRDKKKQAWHDRIAGTLVIKA
jgi:uncharacterized RDD family membrane protein YckC